MCAGPIALASLVLPLAATVRQANIVVMKNVPQIVRPVPLIATAHQANIVVVLPKVPVANVLGLVLDNRVKVIPIVDWSEPVVIVVKILLASVLQFVLENRVKRIPTV